MKIWRLDPGRALEWREIRLESLLRDPMAFGSLYRDWASQPLSRFEERLRQARHFATGERLGQPLAVACWQAGLDLENPKLGWVMSVYARPIARGRGYSDALFDHLAQDAAKAGMTSLGLHVGQGNHAALRLYHRCGFRDSGATHILNDFGLPEYRLIRDL